MTLLTNILPFDLQKEVGRFEHQEKLKAVHKDLLLHIRTTFEYYNTHGDRYNRQVYAITDDGEYGYHWFIVDSKAPYFRTVNDAKQAVIDHYIWGFKNLKTFCTPVQYHLLLEEVLKK
jgi:hypothetical protein